MMGYGSGRVGSGGFCFRFEDNRWLDPGGEDKALGLPHSAVFPHQLIQGTGIQGPHGAGDDANGFQSLRQSLQAKVAFLHLGILSRPELRRPVGAFF